MIKIPFEDGTLVKAGYVEIDGVKYEVIPAEYTGETPLSAYNLKKMQDNVEDATMINRIILQGNSIQEGTPSIDSEAPIESVGDNINFLKLYSENLSKTKNGVEIKINEGYSITLNGTATSDTWVEVVYTFPDNSHQQTNATINLNTMETYQFTVKELSGSKSNGNVSATIQTDNLNTLVSISPDTKPTTTIKNASGVYRTYIYFASGTILNNYTFGLSLTKGTSTGAYSPYGQGSIEIKQQNANLFDISKVGYCYNCSINDKVITSTELTGNFQFIQFNFNDIFLIANNTYTISLKIKMDKGTYINGINSLQLFGNETMIGEAKRIKNFKLTNEYQIYVFEITSSENTILNRMLLQLVTDASEVIMSVKDIQLEKGLTETKYVEHQSQTKALYTQQPFRAIKDVKDRFIKKDGVWHEEHLIYRRIFDGTEDWAWVKANESIALYQVLLPNVGYYSGSSKELLCNMFYGQASGVLWGLPSEGICINSIKNLQIATSDILNSVENWKAKLQQLYNAGTPLYVDYILATPTLIPCTPEQVESLSDICSSYGKGLTNITCTDEVTPVIEIVKASKETVQSENDKVINILLKRVSQLEQLVASVQNTTVEEEA